MELLVKRLDKDAVLPSFAHDSDAGADIYVLEKSVIPAGQQTMLRTGIALQIPAGYVGLIWDKSGVSAKRCLKVMGGVIDAGYRGELLVTLANLGNTEQVFEKGEKIAQLLIQPVFQPAVVEVDELENSARGAGGFGSTGK